MIVIILILKLTNISTNNYEHWIKIIICKGGVPHPMALQSKEAKIHEGGLTVLYLIGIGIYLGINILFGLTVLGPDEHD